MYENGNSMTESYSEYCNCNSCTRRREVSSTKSAETAAPDYPRMFMNAYPGGGYFVEELDTRFKESNMSESTATTAEDEARQKVFMQLQEQLSLHLAAMSMRVISDYIETPAVETVDVISSLTDNCTIMYNYFINELHYAIFGKEL